MADKKSALDKYKLNYQKGRQKFRVSPSFGKKQHWIIRASKAAKTAVMDFFSNVIAALKVIAKEIM